MWASKILDIPATDVDNLYSHYYGHSNFKVTFNIVGIFSRLLKWTLSLFIFPRLCISLYLGGYNKSFPDWAETQYRKYGAYRESNTFFCCMEGPLTSEWANLFNYKQLVTSLPMKPTYCGRLIPTQTLGSTLLCGLPGC